MHLESDSHALTLPDPPWPYPNPDPNPNPTLTLALTQEMFARHVNPLGARARRGATSDAVCANSICMALSTCAGIVAFFPLPSSTCDPLPAEYTRHRGQRVPGLG